MIHSSIKRKTIRALSKDFELLEVGDTIERVPRASTITRNTTFYKPYKIVSIGTEYQRELVIYNDHKGLSMIRREDFINRYSALGKKYPGEQLRKVRERRIVCLKDPSSKVILNAQQMLDML